MCNKTEKNRRMVTFRTPETEVDISGELTRWFCFISDLRFSTFLDIKSGMQSTLTVWHSFHSTLKCECFSLFHPASNFAADSRETFGGSMWLREEVSSSQQTDGWAFRRFYSPALHCRSWQEVTEEAGGGGRLVLVRSIQVFAAR